MHAKVKSPHIERDLRVQKWEFRHPGWHLRICRFCSQDLWSSNLYTIPFRLDMSSQLTLVLFAISLIFCWKNIFHAAEFLKRLNESKLLFASVIKPLLWTFYLICLIICNIHSPSTLSETPVHLWIHAIIESCGSRAVNKITLRYRPMLMSLNVHTTTNCWKNLTMAWLSVLDRQVWAFQKLMISWDFHT